jgi:ADP-ribose pyrophosphatase
MHRSVRIILINSKNELALVCADDPNMRSSDGTYAGRFWFLPGGKIEAHESMAEAVYRELQEETGLGAQDLVLGPQVWEGTVHLQKNGKPWDIQQYFFVVWTRNEHLNFYHLDSWESKCLEKLAWFSLEAIQNSQEIIYPVGLEELLPDILQKKFPEKPIRIDLNRKRG